MTEMKSSLEKLDTRFQQAQAAKGKINPKNQNQTLKMEKECMNGKKGPEEV